MASTAGSRKSGNLAAVVLAGGRASPLGGAGEPGGRSLGRAKPGSRVPRGNGGAGRSWEGRWLGGVLGPLRPAEVTTSAVAGQAPPWLDLDTREDVAAALALAAQESSLTERQGSR